MNDAQARAREAYEARKRAQGYRLLSIRLDPEANAALDALILRYGNVKEAICQTLQWAAAFHAYHAQEAKRQANNSSSARC